MNQPSKYTELQSKIMVLVDSRSNIWSYSACGVTRSELPIPAIVHKDAYKRTSKQIRVLLIGGLSGFPQDVEIAIKSLEIFSKTDADLSERIALSAIPCANPAGLAIDSGPSNGAGGTVIKGYPPIDGFYFDRENPEVRYIWRWVCYQAPDLIVEIQHGPETEWHTSDPNVQIDTKPKTSLIPTDDSLLAALATGNPSDLGTIPGVRLISSKENLENNLNELWKQVIAIKPGPSQARNTLVERDIRTTYEVGEDLSKSNGRILETMIYTQSVAISGRLRLEALHPSNEGLTDEVEKLVSQFMDKSTDKLYGSEPNSADIAGVVWAEELFLITSDVRYKNLLIDTANLIRRRGPDKPHWPLNLNFAAEDFFMSAAVLGRAFKVTGSEHYLDLLLEFITTAGTQEESGLFPHNRFGPFHWGRGNGFAALGLTESLTYLPKNHPGRDLVLNMYKKLMEALKPLQEPSGMYGQLIDFSGSYHEFTSTSMIGYSMARGIRLGWIDNSYIETVLAAWIGIKERIDKKGNIVDGCTGSGVMDNRRSYLDRPANSGYDDRSGSMALWFTAEIADLNRKIQLQQKN